MSYRNSLQFWKISYRSAQKFPSAILNYNILYGLRRHTTMCFPKLLKSVENNILIKCFSPCCLRDCVRRNFSESKSEPEEDPVSKEKVKIIFVTSEGEEIEVEGEVGTAIMEIGLKHNVGMEGACEGQLACTTCHIYVDEEYSKYISPATTEEEDMLDMAPFLKANSRLSCQLFLKKELEGAKFRLPPATVNFFVDGFKPKH